MNRKVLVAYGYAFLAMAMFTLEAAALKLIGPDINAPQVGVARCLFQLAALALWRRRAPGLLFASTRPRMQIARGLLSAVGTVGYYYVFANLPLATATVVFFTSVIFTTMAAGPILGETVGWRRWTATLVGFAGILLVVRPASVPLSLPLAVAFLVAINAATIALATKGLTRTERVETIMAYIAATTLFTNLPWALAVWTTPDIRIAALTLFIAAIGTLGQYASIRSFSGADASGVAPIGYIRIVLAGVVGYWMFQETPDGLTIVGSSLIAGSALFITIREAQLKRRPAGPAPDR